MSHTDEDFTELIDADIPRVDIVGKAANGRKWALIKSEPLLTADEVSELVKEAEHSLQEGDMSTETSAPEQAVIKDEPDLDVTEPLAEPDDALDQLEAVTPGSPAWEQVDAATAIKWAGILARAKNALELLADREGTEAVTVDPDDAENQWNLEDASCAIDYAIGVLGAFAAGEQAEADIAQEMEQVGKSAIELDGQLPTLEALGAVLKAGRTLSKKNEDALRDAADSIQKVLASLPAAPDDIEKKEAVMAENTVVKADDDTSLTAVFNQNGKLIGVVPADQIQAVSGAGADTSDDTSTDADTDSTDAASTTDADGNEPTADQTAATTPSDQPIPGTDTIQSPNSDDADVKKGSLNSEVLEALGEVLAPIAKKLDAHAELATTVQDLKEKLEKLAKSPDDRRSPILNGASGVAGLADRDGTEDPSEVLRKAIDAETDADTRRGLMQKLAYAEIRSRFTA